MIPRFWTDMPWQIVQTKIRLLLLQEQFDQGLHCLPFHMHLLDVKASLLAHLSRRLLGELIVYEGIRRPLVRPSVNIFKGNLL